MVADPLHTEFYGPILLVEEIVASVKFYRDDLRLRRETAGPWAELQIGSSRLVLLERGFWSKVTSTRPRAASAVNGGAVVLAIQVADVDEVDSRLQALAFRFEKSPTDVPPIGLRLAILRDADGRLVELTSPLG